MFKVIKVKGESMLPDIQPGDYLIIRTFYKKFRVGDIVVLQHRDYGVIVKKITQLLDNGKFLVKSTNPHGISSSEIGILSIKQIIGIKLFHVRQP